MRLARVSEQEALDKVKALVIDYEQPLLRWRDELLAETGTSADLRAYVSALVHMSSGNSMWNSTTLRYKV